MKKLIIILLSLFTAFGASAQVNDGDLVGSWTRKITDKKDWYHWTFYLTFIYKDGGGFAQKGAGVLYATSGGKEYKVTLDYSSSGVYVVDGDDLTINLDPTRTVMDVTQEGLPEFICGILDGVEKYYRKSLAKPIRFKIMSVGDTQMILTNGQKEKCIFNKDR